MHQHFAAAGIRGDDRDQAAFIEFRGQLVAFLNLFDAAAWRKLNFVTIFHTVFHGAILPVYT